MDLIQRDILGSASKNKEVEGVNKRLIKEAYGGKRFNKLEIVARMILLKSSLALSATDERKKSERISISSKDYKNHTFTYILLGK